MTRGDTTDAKDVISSNNFSLGEILSQGDINAGNHERLKFKQRTAENSKVNVSQAFEVNTSGSMMPLQNQAFKAPMTATHA